MNIFKMKTGGSVEVATFHLPQKIASEIVSDEREMTWTTFFQQTPKVGNLFLNVTWKNTPLLCVVRKQRHVCRAVGTPMARREGGLSFPQILEDHLTLPQSGSSLCPADYAYLADYAHHITTPYSPPPRFSDLPMALLCTALKLYCLIR